MPGRTVERATEQIVASVYSLSGSAPHLFGDRLDAFEAQLRKGARRGECNGRFSEQMREIALDVWR